MERCSNCHSGIIKDKDGNKQCVNNYTYCDYSKTKPKITNAEKIEEIKIFLNNPMNTVFLNNDELIKMIEDIIKK